jgi:hypothetical protein
MISYNVMCVSLLFAIPLLGGCQYANKPTEKTENTHVESLSVTDVGYKNWHEQMLQSKNAINADKEKITNSYDAIRSFNKESMTTSWLNEISTVMAQNATYRQSILDSAGHNKIDFSQALLNNPKNAIYYKGASEALIDGFKWIEKFDYQYRNLSNAFEDSARGRIKKTVSNSKNISTIALNIYTSKGTNPSVAEQLLTIAAIKILGVHDNPKLQMGYHKVLSNKPIESCLANAQRNSAQCKAASYDKNDLSFCMAKHAIGETAQCFSWILP